MKFPRLLPFFLAASAWGADGAATAPVPAARLPILFVCGDSTAARDRPPILGWGEKIGEFFDPARLRVENRALGGRSARTFLEEGRWEAVRRQLQKGDFVFLQFGHNDTKSTISANRYDLPGLGDEAEEAADPRTGAKIQIHTYGYYLRRMIREGIASGATVIVLSPVPRNRWVEGKIVRGEEGHGPWAAELARENGVMFVDVNGMIADLYDPVGPARLKALFFPQDNTHTNPAGARLNAAAVVKGLLEQKSPLTADLADHGAADAAQAIAAVPAAAAAVALTLNVKALFPAEDAANVCPDTPLRLTFSEPPTLGSGGKITIADASTHAVVATIDAGARTALKTIGGISGFNYYPVIIAGREAEIYPRNGALAYNRTYEVTIDSGFFKGGADHASGLGLATAWHFTTKAAPPAPGTPRLTVAADGSGDFCTVQGALDFIPEGNTAPVTIFIQKGTYTEIVAFTRKHALTLLGEDRRQTVLAYANNAKFNDGGGNPYGGATPNPSAEPAVGGHLYRRGLLLAHQADDLTISNLTLRNTTPRGGSQSEALILNGTTTARAVLRDVDLVSFQDTLQINGQAYLHHCSIEGDVDFMWGTGPCFFEGCTARSVRSGAFYTQIRNPGTNHGYVYLHCTFDGLPGVTGNDLSRIGTGRFPHSEVVLIDCVLTAAVGPVAWQFQSGREGDPANAAEVHFWECNSHDPEGRPVDVSRRLAGSRQLRRPEDAATIADYSHPSFVLGGGWSPR